MSLGLVPPWKTNILPVSKLFQPIPTHLNEIFTKPQNNTGDKYSWPIKNKSQIRPANQAPATTISPSNEMPLCIPAERNQVKVRKTHQRLLAIPK
jgi:hypothetical protein